MFDGAVVKRLDELAVGARVNLDLARTLDAVAVKGGLRAACIGVEAREHHSSWTHDVQQAVHDGLCERLGQVLEVIPEKGSVEVTGGKAERLLEKVTLARGGGVGDGGVAITEHGIHAADEVLGIETVAERGEEGDVVLVYFAEVEDLQVLVVTKDVEQLFQGG